MSSSDCIFPPARRTPATFLTVVVPCFEADSLAADGFSGSSAIVVFAVVDEFARTRALEGGTEPDPPLPLLYCSCSRFETLVLTVLLTLVK